MTRNSTSAKLYITEEMFEAWWKSLAPYQQLMVTQNIAETFAKRHLKGVAIKEIQELTEEIKEDVAKLRDAAIAAVVAEYARTDYQSERVISLTDKIRSEIKIEVANKINDILKKEVAEQVKLAVKKLDATKIDKCVVDLMEQHIREEVRQELKEKLGF